MKVFFDTSSLVKLYHYEDGTEELDQLFSKHFITGIFISEITKVEFFSAIYKKLRTKSIESSAAESISASFLADQNNYNCISVDTLIVSSAYRLIEKYGPAGLRTLDAIQLASACKMIGVVDLAISDDKLLNSFFLSENIKISL